MNCKHLQVQGTTTKYFFCGAKQKAINEYECRSCPLKIEKKADLPDGFEQLFGKLKR